MLVTRTSPFTGITRTLDIDITPEQVDEYIEGKKCIQDVFPNLSPGDREFIKTGITSEEWDDTLSGSEA